ncbi:MULTISPECIES: carbohydrate ABC transporter permease [Streptomyces]|uniref:carbohydrate ABC transporter permease n=1 Tax=Streptomyces TaxID=1883 RepID=UPI00167A3308|nr:sugar ABC transporter permease [Streptomyces umbrinus]MCR3724554.1 multiple sugar transport system permease protein [Streptomyces umbrinus]MCX4563557.1 sugar ABC transporter permease [Streptomyces phaeochromogenes]GHB67253.1 ABC transporter permease [Streptomyces umbrinus]GHH51078.1 ABC transporter permease [Streptomyces umbrinus]
MPTASDTTKTTETTKSASAGPSGTGGTPPGRGAQGGRRKPEFTARRGFLIAAFMAPAAVFVAVFTYYPMIAGSQMAFRNWKLADLTDTSWVGLKNFRDVFADPAWGTVLGNTGIWVFGSIVPQLVIGFALALWLRKKFRFRGLYQALIFFPWAISGFLIGILFRWMFNSEFGVVNDLLQKVGLIDEPVAWLADPQTAMFAVVVANIWYGVTFFTIMILAALQSIPEELYEAAALDGAGKVRTLFQITIPYIRVTLALTVLLRVIWIFNFPDLIFGMTGGGPNNETHIVTTWMIKITQQGDYGRASALGLIVVATLLVFAVFFLLATREKREVKS